uniref:Transmembrane protein n=1 Tax=Globisporangium ultimum (strain ATCC 200006 / CBS 805.95 / DAOM BR144) TaxID=431595 RepID=K3WKF8_GLOUD
MASLPRISESRDDLHALRPIGTLSPSGRRESFDASASAAASLRMRSFTAEDLPSEKKKPFLTQSRRAASEMLQTSKSVIMQGINGINRENVAKIGDELSEIVEKVKKTFTQDESERLLKADWIIVETEEDELAELKDTIEGLEKAFQFSKSNTMVDLATSTLQRCDELVDRSVAHTEQCNLVFSQCSNEIATLNDYLDKLRAAVNPIARAKDKNEEKRNARRAEWAISRMQQSIHSMVSDMKETLDEIDDLTTECTKLMVQSITLLHLRAQSADFSGTGVAAGAAGVVAGALVGVAGVIAAPATGGLSIPISVAGKGLFFTGLAALTPSSILLNRQSQQLTGLTKLVENLKSRLEIMNQKRAEIAIAHAAGESVEINIKQAGNFIQDAIELEIPTFESSWSFIEEIGVHLTTLSKPVELFLTTPSIWHYCKSEDALHHYLLPDEDDE